MQAIEIYDIYYREYHIGVLMIDSATNLYRYEPNADGVAKVQKIAPLDYNMVHGTDGFVPPIPFFEERIRNMKRWGLTELNYHTDYFCIFLREAI